MSDRRYWAKVADTLDGVAAALEKDRSMDPDGAVRLVLWGTSETPRPVGDTADSELFDEASSLIECYVAQAQGYDPGNGIQHLDRRDAITAARAEARRVRHFR
jgi:hypothetical protein